MIGLLILQGGRVVFKATTFRGFVGVLTGMKPSCFSISVNFRTEEHQDNKWDTARSHLGAMACAAGGSWPVGFLVRRVLEDDLSYSAAKAQLEACPVIRPVYFTLWDGGRGRYHDDDGDG